MTIDIPFMLTVLFRWLHILAAITAVGGSIFMRLALLPSLDTLQTEQRTALQQALRSRWAKWVGASILFLLVSGLYNFMTIVTRYKMPPAYHMLFGIKFLLALVIFFLASVLVGRTKLAQKIQQNARTWLTLNVVLAVLVVCISGVMRTIPRGPEKEKNQPAQTATAPSVVEIRHG